VEGFHCTGLTGPAGCADRIDRAQLEYTTRSAAFGHGRDGLSGLGVPALAGRYVYAD